MRGLSLAWFPAWFPAWVRGRGAKRRILEKTRRRGPGVLRPERAKAPRNAATVMKVVWQGFPGERTRSPAGSRKVKESCVASLLFIGVGGSGRRPSRIRRPRRACGALEIQYTERSSMKSSTVEQNRGEGGWGAKQLVKLRSHRIGGLLV